MLEGVQYKDQLVCYILVAVADVDLRAQTIYCNKKKLSHKVVFYYQMKSDSFMFKALQKWPLTVPWCGQLRDFVFYNVHTTTLSLNNPSPNYPYPLSSQLSHIIK